MKETDKSQGVENTLSIDSIHLSKYFQENIHI